MSQSRSFERLNEAVNMETARKLQVPIGIVLAALILRPLLGFLIDSSYIATTILIWMMFAAAFNLLFGYAGLLSFGHAMFLGAGVYATAIGLAHFGLPFSLMTVVGVILASAIAYTVGRITVRYGEIYFAMLTLAFAMGAQFIVNANPYGLTGGSDGIRSGAVPNWIASFRGERVIDINWVANLFEVFGLEPSYYWFVALVFVATMLLLWQVIRSPFGRTLVAIRDNEELARAMGVSTNRYKVWAFTISGAFSAVAGALMMINNYGASLADLGPHTSSEVLLMTIFGGANFFAGPLIGAFGWFGIQEFLQSFETLRLPVAGAIDVGGILSYWRFFFGLAFVVVILVSPRDGIWGFIRGHVSDVIAAVRRWNIND